MRRLLFGTVITMLVALGLTPQAGAAISATERQALIDLYNSTNGANWTNHTNWNGAAGTEYTWYGVTCDAGGTTVQKLVLSSNNLVGTIPTSLGNLTNLTSLWFADNQLTGSIPASLGSLTNLTGLYLSSNRLSGSIPAELGNLTNLLFLYLYNNQLTGSIPTDLGSLTNLLQLELDANQLTGSIPSDLGSLTNLTFLGLDHNQLTGAIPTQLANLTNLLTFSLGSNHLTGSIPAWLGSLTNLTDLELYSNQLTGTIPTSLGSLTGLQRLDLDGNQLTGTIPTQLGSLTNLVRLDLFSNQLTGSIPTQLGSLTNLQQLFLSYNQLTGTIPTQLGSLTHLQNLNLGVNQLTGTIPTQLGNLTSLSDLELNNNQLTGSIPTWLGDLTKLQYLYLSSNQLTGSIPTSLGSLTNLQQLDLDTNQLTGSIPTQLGSLTNLTGLYLFTNQLTGTIPLQLGSLTNLQNLYLYGNKLSGSIPAQLGSLTNLQYLDLSLNQLTGSIPELSKLTNLQYLYLFGNQFSGSIPTSLESLTSLIAGDLDLRYNALYSTDPTLTIFLNGKQQGGDWHSTQTIAPTGVAAGVTTNNSVALAWTPITYTGDTGGYQTYYSTTSGGPYTTDGITANKSASSIVVSGLNPGTLYYFVVCSVTNPNAHNQNTVTSGPSTEVHATTSGTACTSPSITSQPLGQSIQSAHTATLTVTAIGSAPLSFQWYHGTSGDTSHPVGTNSSSFTTPALTAITSYWVRVSNSCGYADSATAIVMVGVTFTNIVWVPVVSHNPGKNNSQWRSDLGLLNRGTATAHVKITFYGSSVASTTTQVAAQSQSILVDVVNGFGVSESAALEIQSDQPLLVTSRSYNLAPSGWTYGQGYDGVASSDCLAAGQTAWLPQLMQNGIAGQVGTYRTNIGITNTGSGDATVTLVLYDANGTEVWSDSRDYAPGQFYQYQEPFRTGAGRTDIGQGYATVTVNTGSGVVAYASVTDNGSSDPTTITMKR